MPDVQSIHLGLGFLKNIHPSIQEYKPKEQNIFSWRGSPLVGGKGKRFTIFADVSHLRDDFTSADEHMFQAILVGTVHMPWHHVDTLKQCGSGIFQIRRFALREESGKT